MVVLKFPALQNSPVGEAIAQKKAQHQQGRKQLTSEYSNKSFMTKKTALTTQEVAARFK